MTGTDTSVNPAGSPAGTGRTLGLVIAMVVGTAVTLILGIQPILLGALAHAGRLSAMDLGRVATVEILALALGSGIGPRLANHLGLRSLTLIASLALAAVNFAIGMCDTPLSLYGDRAAAGLIEGLALSATIVILTHDRSADRVNAVFLALSTIPQVIAAYTLAALVIPTSGVNAGFYVLGGAMLVAALFSLPLGQRRSVAGDAGIPVRIAWSPVVILGLASIFVHGAGIGGAWTYLEALAREHHIAPAAVGLALAGSLGCQVIGALVVAWVGWRIPYSLALVTCSLLQAAIVIGLAINLDTTAFIALAFAFGFFWLALAPFQIQIMLALDPSRSAALLLTPLSLIGFSAGPLVASLAVEPGRVGGALFVAAAMLTTAALLYVTTLTLQRRSMAD